MGQNRIVGGHGHGHGHGHHGGGGGHHGHGHGGPAGGWGPGGWGWDEGVVYVEGASCELGITIMQSDWRPKVLCVEHDGRGVEIMQVAKKHGYKAIEMNTENLILARCV